MSKQPTYVGGHGLLEGKHVLVTAAAGTGIGFATAMRCAGRAASNRRFRRRDSTRFPCAVCTMRRT